MQSHTAITSIVILRKAWNQAKIYAILAWNQVCCHCEAHEQSECNEAIHENKIVITSAIYCAW